MKNEKLTFQNAEGQTLAARLELPIDQHPVAYALFAHCFTCNKNLNAVRNISRALTQEGIAVLRFDFTGLGESEGDFADTNFSSNVADLVEAGNFMGRELEAPSLLIGHSLGGAAVLLAAKELESVKGVVTIGAPSSPEHVSHQFEGNREEIEQSGKAKVSIGGRPFTIKKQFIKDIESQNLADKIKNLKRALLVMHSPIDKIVSVDNAKDIYLVAMHPKSFISLDDADHLLSKKEDSLYAGDLIACWAKRYLKSMQKDSLKSHRKVAARIGNSGFTTDIKAGPHYLTADEPEDVGGNNFGPTPYDLLSAGLGACTAMTLRMYADQKKWDLQEVRVHLSHGKDWLQDCKDNEEEEKKGAKIDIIERDIELEGDLDEKQRKRLMEIADRCPVHRTLHSEVVVRTQLKE